MIRAALISLLLLSPVLADVIPSGMRGISHEVLFEGMEKFPETTFVLYPVGMGDRANTVKAGESAYWKYASPQLFAVKGDLPASDGLEAYFADASLPRSEGAFSRTGLVDEDDPRGRIRTVYTIVSIEGAVITLSKSEQVFDVDDTLIESAPPATEPSPAEASPADDSTPTEASPAAESVSADSADAGGLCTLRPGRALPLLGLSALALCGLVLAGLRRSD